MVLLEFKRTCKSTNLELPGLPFSFIIIFCLFKSRKIHFEKNYISWLFKLYSMPFYLFSTLKEVHTRYTYTFLLKCFIKMIYRLFDIVRGIENVSLFYFEIKRYQNTSVY